ncbi:MAG: hypothetical protein DRI36_04840 [Caldiserica bacterium]|nr:MAG: hypothetical protein DRI36_04840 [Caldisericota bacterium]
MNWLRRVMRMTVCFRHLLFVICHLSFLIASSFASTVDVNIFVRPGHKIPPEPVTDLVAKTGINIGEIELTWTAPKTTWDIDIRWFYIRYATFSVNDSPFLGDTTEWWDSANGIYEISNWWKSGEKVTLTIGGLSPQLTYYFAIKSEDEFGNISDIDLKTKNLNQAHAMAAWDMTPPARITTLVAEVGNVEGEIKLSWISPGDDGTVGQITDGKWKIKYATYSVVDWNEGVWNDYDDKYELVIDTDTSPLSFHSITITGLHGGVTYYFRIWASDDIPNWSEVSNGATTYAQVDVTSPSKVTDLRAEPGFNEITLFWTSPGDDGIDKDIINGKVEVIYSTSQVFIPYNSIIFSTSTSKFEFISYTVTGLKGDTTYYFRIRIADERGNFSELSNKATSYTFDNVPPIPPTSLIAIAGDREVELIWTESISKDVVYYNVYRSTDILNYEFIGLSTSTHYLDKGLMNLVTYWYYVTCIDEAGNESSSSTVVAAMPVTGDYIAPLPPYGIRGEFVDGKLKLKWIRPYYNVDGSVCDDLTGFIIYRSSSIWQKGVAIVTLSSSTLFYEVPVSTYISYYRIAAIDDASPYPNESDASFVIDSGRNLYVIRDEVVVKIPVELQDEILGNPQDAEDDFVLRVDTFTPTVKGVAIGGYEIEALKAKEWKEEAGITFSIPEIEFAIYYEKEKKIIRKAMKLTNGEFTPTKLALFWFNGVKWIRVGGDVDEIEKKLYIKTARLGRYELRLSYKVGSFILHTVYPKIFTPNGDGRNDIVEFQYENPEGFAPTGKIFDIKGRFIANLKLGPNSSSTSGSLIWDGKDNKGNICESGVYIYEIEAGGEVYNGTVILAK